MKTILLALAALITHNSNISAMDLTNAEIQQIAGGGILEWCSSRPKCESFVCDTVPPICDWVGVTSLCTYTVKSLCSTPGTGYVCGPPKRFHDICTFAAGANTSLCGTQVIHNCVPNQGASVCNYSFVSNPGILCTIDCAP